jgi:hypothetical protein
MALRRCNRSPKKPATTPPTTAPPVILAPNCADAA